MSTPPAPCPVWALLRAHSGLTDADIAVRTGLPGPPTFACAPQPPLEPAKDPHQ